MRCDNCHADAEAGLRADLVGYSFSPETPQQKGKAVIFKRYQLSYTPFSVWFCAACIDRNRRRIRWFLPPAVLLDILVSLLFGKVSVTHPLLQLPVALLLLLLVTITFYLTAIVFKPLQRVREEDLPVLFFSEINEIRFKKTGLSFHMTQRRYQKRHRNKTAQQ